MTRIDLGPGYHRLTDGLVVNLVLTPEGRSVAVQLCAPGDVLVETEGADLNALGPHRFAPADRDAYLESLEGQLERTRRLAGIRALRVSEALPEALALLCGLLGTRTLPMTHEEVACCVGVGRETVTKELNLLAKAGGVRLRYRTIEVPG